MQFIERTTACGNVSSQHLSKEICLAGWVHKRRDHGGLIFIDLRDRSGLMQLVFNPDFDKEAHTLAHSLRSEFVIAVCGTVVEREPETVNPDLATGKYELQVRKLYILNKATQLPFSLDDADIVDEELRLKYRYLDLRREKMRKRFELRNNVFFAIREFLHNDSFFEIETPILTKNTPEGAREFLVPSRMHKGSFYALPQSPQLYKQLLMASGFEKYYQIARCFRDEDLRADRQPEFTQLDMEMSFVSEDDIITVIERMFSVLWKKIFKLDLTTPFERLSYQKAFADYGSDKPDLRYGLKIHDCTPLFENTELKFIKSVLDAGGKVGGIHVRDYEFSRSELDAWVPKAQQLGAKGLLWIRFKDGKADSPVSKFLPDDFFAQAKKIFPDLKETSILFLMAGKYKQTWTLLGRLRGALAQELNIIPQGVFKFCWVTDFPLMEYDPETKRWNSMHHPFTCPEQDWQQKEPADIKARAYDIILNGVELGGGSIRIHKKETQEKIFELLQLTPEQTKEKFGFLLEAQELGFPPHGGIALGLDRLIMIMSNADSIREVIAFPKTASGYDPLMEGPTPVDEAMLKEYGLKLIPKKK